LFTILSAREKKEESKGLLDQWVKHHFSLQHNIHREDTIIIIFVSRENLSMRGGRAFLPL
jgi:hypothetical protein